MNKELYYNLRASLGKQKQNIYLNAIYPLILKRRAKAIGKKDKIEVVFFAMNIATWRYQGVYDLLSKDERFNCHVVFTVAQTYTKEQQSADLEQMRAYFDSKKIKYVDHDVKNILGYDVKSKINPDILFFPQPYDDIFLSNHDYKKFTTKLICYIPYSINVVKEADWLYDLDFHNIAWKIYRPFKHEKKLAEKYSRNKGRNNVASGYLNIDRYLSDQVVDVWKIKDRNIKRLIWAPHFTIISADSWLKGRSNFMWMAQLMLDMAIRYKDKLQIAFKPHPRLKSELYQHSEWGKEKTDKYYNNWCTMENTQLETGDFIDLFKTSDAMIHDSGSFTAEYLFVNKPVAFVTGDFEKLLEEHSDFGKEALKNHYILGREDEVYSFIDTIVLDEKDTMLYQRTDFFEKVLKPNVIGTTSQFIVDDIKTSLGLEK